MAAGGPTVAELYNPATGTWAKTGALSAYRDFQAGVMLPSGKVMVIGGTDGAKAVNTAEMYDPATGKWAATATMAAARGFPAATVLPSGKVLVTGGFGANGAPLASAEICDPRDQQVDAGAAAMASPRSVLTATLLSNKTVLVSGEL